MSMSEDSCARTARWLARCKAEHARLNALPDTVNPQQMLWGINQGGTYATICAVEHMKRIADLDLPGYAIGGLAVGEPTEVMYELIETVEPHMPTGEAAVSHGRRDAGEYHRRRGPGHRLLRLRDARPERTARQALHLGAGRSTCDNAKYARTSGPLDPDCDCPVCRRYYAGHICAICSRPRRCWPCALRSCTIFISTTN